MVHYGIVVELAVAVTAALALASAAGLPQGFSQVTTKARLNLRLLCDTI